MKTIAFGRHAFEVSDQLDLYLSIKRQFVDLSEHLRKDAKNWFHDGDFKEACGMSEDDSLTNGIAVWGLRMARSKLEYVVQIAMAALSGLKCRTVDYERYVDEYLNLDITTKCVAGGACMKVLIEIENEEEDRETERTARTDRLRRMWRGGGFGGIKTIVKGALQAEALNLAGGALSGLVNMFSRSRSRSNMQEELQTCFELFRLELAEAIFEEVVANADCLIRCIRENCGIEVDDNWPNLNHKAAKGILGNLKEMRVPKDEVDEAKWQMLNADPFYQDAYEWMFENAKGSTREVEDIAKYFCVSLRVVIAEKMELEAQKLKAKRARQAKRRQQKAERLRESDEATRTVFGEVWPTVDDMERAKGDVDEFYKGIVSFIRYNYNGQDSFVGERLTEKKLAKAKTAFSTLPGERILWALDTSFWYTLGSGLIFTTLGVRWRNRDEKVSKVNCLSWNDFATLKEDPRVSKDGTLLQFTNDAVFDMDVNCRWADKWLPILLTAKKFWREGMFSKPDVEMVSGEDESK